MANYKLSSSVVAELHIVARYLASRRVAHMEAGFPLSRDQVQAGLLPARWREIVPELAGDGFAMPRDTNPRVELHHGSMPRRPTVSVTVKPGVFVRDVYKDTIFDAGALDRATLESLARWANTAVAERRQAGLILRTVQEFFSKHADTTGHVQARWPALVMLADRLPDAPGSSYVSTHKAEQRENWKEKFHETSRSAARYGWSSTKDLEWVRRWEKAMKVAEAVLAGTLLLSTTVADDAPVRASVGKWTPLPDDPDRDEPQY